MIELQIDGVGQSLFSDLNVRLAVQFNWSNQSDSVRYIGWSGNLSIGGVYVRDAIADPPPAVAVSYAVKIILEQYFILCQAMLTSANLTMLISSSGEKVSNARLDYVLSGLTHGAN